MPCERLPPHALPPPPSPFQPPDTPTRSTKISARSTKISARAKTSLRRRWKRPTRFTFCSSNLITSRRSLMKRSRKAARRSTAATLIPSWRLPARSVASFRRTAGGHRGVRLKAAKCPQQL
eukprot:6172773-Prymnesium_polylepis.1